MKVAVGKLVNSYKALQELATAKLPAASALRVALCVQRVDPVVSAFQVQYNALLTRVGTARDDGSGQFDITDRDTYNQELEGLMAEEVEVPDEKVANFGSAEISAASLLALDWLVQL